MFSDEEKETLGQDRGREVSPGSLLIAGRERAGLTQEQVARDLYMTPTKVCALELDDYRHMGSGTFIRGYLRAYANLVKVDVAEVLAAYDRLANRSALANPVPSQSLDAGTKPLWQSAIFIVGALLLLWLISVWFFDNRKAREYDLPANAVAPITPVNIASSAAMNSAPTEAALVDGFDVEEDQSSALKTQLGVNISTNATVATSSVSSAPASSVSAPVVSNKIQAAALDELIFRFSEECWLEVSDSRGDVLVTDLQPARSKLVLHGQAPFNVKLGNAPATKIELNSVEVSVVPALGTNVLSMKVGEPTPE